jgi:hypothetical protein
MEDRKNANNPLFITPPFLQQSISGSKWPWAAGGKKLISLIIISLLCQEISSKEGESKKEGRGEDNGNEKQISPPRGWRGWEGRLVNFQRFKGMTGDFE